MPRHSARTVKQTPFTKNVIAVILKIPKGKVATYGQVAKLAGKPGSSRAVGWILHSCSKAYALPWQRVLNSQGKISFKKGSSEFRKQKSLLEREGIEVSVSGQLNLKACLWKKRAKSSLHPNAPKMFR
jgi:methylated-DNA-protein-cysteine methyltransferase-like protein